MLSETLNAPLANIVILILGKESFAEAATDANGNFEVYGLPAGIYDVMIAQAKYEFFSKKGLEIKAGAPPLEIDFILKPAVGDQSKINSPIAPSLLGSLLVRLLSLDFGFAGEAYAADACEVCVNCSSKEFNNIVANYEKNAAQYPESSIFDPFADALVCVSNGLRSSCQNFNSPSQLLNTMQCIQKKALAHDSACWLDARWYCGFMDATIDYIYPAVVTRTACTLAQEMCEKEDRDACWTLGEISVSKNSDGWKAVKEVGKCLPSIGYDLF